MVLPGRNWKLYLGVFFFAASWLPWFTAEFFLLLPLSDETIVCIVLAYWGVAEIFFLASVWLLGKPLVTAVTRKTKDRVLHWRKSKKPPSQE